MPTDESAEQEGSEIGKIQSPNLSALLAVIAVGILVESIDGNIVSVALPRMAVDLSSGISVLSWVATAYLIVTAATIVPTGKMADIFSKKKIFLLGLGLFGLSSALVGLSPNVYSVIGFRVLQGISATFLLATGYPMIFEFFPPKRAAAAIGIASAVWSVGAVTGPVLGGFLVAIDWRLIFFINVPIVIVGVLVGIKVIPGHSQSNLIRASDRTSTLKLINPVSSIVLALTITTALMWLTLFDFFYAILAFVSGVIFVLVEMKSSDPLINRELLHNRGFMFMLIGGGLITAIAYSGIVYGMSYYFQTVAGVQPEIAGVLVAPLSITLMITSVVSGRLYGKMKAPAMLSFVGMLFGGITLIGIYFLINSGGPPLWELSLLLAAAGISGGFWWVSTLTGLLKFVRPELNGVANGTANMFLSVGFAAGIALTTIVSSTYLTPDLVHKIFLGSFTSLNPIEAMLFGNGIGLAMFVGAIVMFISLPFYLVAARKQRKIG